MFKGPAALTGASTISTTGNIATTSSGTLTIAGTSSLAGAVTTTAGLTVGNALTVSAGGAAITGNSAITGTLSVSQAITATSGITMGGATVTSIERGATPNADSAIIASKKYVAEQVAGAGGGGAPTIVNVINSTSAINLTAVTGDVIYMLDSGGGAITQTSMINVGSIADGTIIRFIVKTFTSAISVGVASGTPFNLVGAPVGSFSFGTVGQGLEFVAASGQLYLLGGGYGV